MTPHTRDLNPSLILAPEASLVLPCPGWVFLARRSPTRELRVRQPERSGLFQCSPDRGLGSHSCSSLACNRSRVNIAGDQVPLTRVPALDLGHCMPSSFGYNVASAPQHRPWFEEEAHGPDKRGSCLRNTLAAGGKTGLGFGMMRFGAIYPGMVEAII
ncbi:hypothetical protein VUR80DRAFT_7202 [Thermomyces stellatus]